MKNIRATPYSHKRSEPVLLDDTRSATFLKSLASSGATPKKMMEMLRELPISHGQKAGFVKNLDIDPVARVELLRELPYSPERELELLRELPLDPMRKLEFLRGLPVDASVKTKFIAELGLPLDMLPVMEDVVAPPQGGAEYDNQAIPDMGLSEERRQSLLEEMRMHDFVESEIARNFAALREAPIPIQEKLEILKQLKLSEAERAELNKNLGFPIDQSEIQTQL